MNRVAVFLVLLVLLSAPIYWLERTTGHPIYSALDSWTPGIAAVLAVAVTRGRLSALGWRGADLRWSLLGWLAIIGALALAQMLGQFTGLAAFPADGALAQAAAEYGLSGSAAISMGVAVIVAATVGVLRFSVSAVGEEIGWRGLLMPELTGRFGFLAASAATGLVWAVWHYPLFWPQYGLAQYAGFTAMVMGLAVLFGALRLASGSIWPAVVAHATFNAMSLKIFAAFWKTGAMGDRAIEVMIGLGCAALGLAIWIRWPAAADGAWDHGINSVQDGVEPAS